VHPRDLGIVFIAATALASLVLCLLAAGALRRTGNRKLGFVTAAFAIFFLKAALTAYSLATGLLDHQDLELAGSALDLAIVFLLVAPFLRR
jgi:hypothetical protein